MTLNCNLGNTLNVVIIEGEFLKNHFILRIEYTTPIHYAAPKSVNAGMFENQNKKWGKMMEAYFFTYRRKEQCFEIHFEHNVKWGTPVSGTPRREYEENLKCENQYFEKTKHQKYELNAN